MTSRRTCLLLVGLSLQSACGSDAIPEEPDGTRGGFSDSASHGSGDDGHFGARGHDAGAGAMDESDGGEEAVTGHGGDGGDAVDAGAARSDAGALTDGGARDAAVDAAAVPQDDAAVAGEDAAVSDAGERDAGGAEEPRDAGVLGPADSGTREHDAGFFTDLCSSCGACEELLDVPAKNLHLDGDLIYGNVPPVAGDHNPCWTRYGVHDAPVPDERWVHNLEHGAVVFLYNCPNGCPRELEQLRALVESCGIFAVLTPYELLPKRFAVVSWGHRMVSDCLDIDAFRSFYERNVDNGNESDPRNPPDYCPP